MITTAYLIWDSPLDRWIRPSLGVLLIGSDDIETTPSLTRRGRALTAYIAFGCATCGEVVFEGRSDCAAIGAVINLARLADEATAGQVLITQRLHAEVEEHVEWNP